MSLLKVLSEAGSRSRVSATRRVVPGIAALLHLAQTVIFFALDLPLHALVSIVALVVFAVAWLCLRAGRERLAMLIVWAEAACHSVWLTWSWGAPTMYPLYWFALASAAFLVYEESDRERLPIALLSFIGGPILFLMFPTGNVAPLSDTVLRGFAVMNLAGVGFEMLVVMLISARATERAETELRGERDRSRDLLHNVLPESIAERLEAQPTEIVDHVDGVSVLFADLVGFTRLATRTSPERLIAVLNDVFSRFDALADALGIEKIKTIGDAYMAVAGLPDPHPNAATAAVKMAQAMHGEVAEVARETGLDLRVRVGIHHGPVIAGVIGRRKFAYDLWGDVVNVASRMESHGEAGRVQVTRAVVDAAPDVSFESRGEIEVKGKGMMPTWWVA